MLEFLISLVTFFVLNTAYTAVPSQKTEVLSETTNKQKTFQNFATVTPFPTATSTPTPEPTKIVYRKEEVKLFDTQWEYNGFPFSCYSYAIPKLKEFEKKVVDATKAYRDCDSTPIDEAIAKGYLCNTECPPEGGQCKVTCPESATRHIEECQAPAKPIWNEWGQMREKYCTQIIPKQN